LELRQVDFEAWNVELCRLLPPLVIKMQTKLYSHLLFSSLALLLSASAHAQSGPIKLDVDATDAPRNILHARLHIPAQPGALTLLYPKWLPGEHEPSGPINDVVNLKMNSNGKSLEWRRDAEDMCAFHLTVPAGADAVDVSLDFLLPTGGGGGGYSSGVSSTAKLLDLSWNQVLLYPKKPNALDTEYVATLRLPAHWKFGTALPLAKNSGEQLSFSAASLETLVDSPVIAGEFFRSIDLAPGEKPQHFLDIVGDSAASLEIKPEDIRHFSHLVAEANALFGAHHYRDYHFLLTVSDHTAHFGLEHHESSDNRQGEKYLTDEDARRLGGSLLPHEMVHSWNGKYRRPAGLATADYSQPMKGELLWVYEGLTTYLGDLLATRSGLWTNEYFRDDLAITTATLDTQAGRAWRPLSDTTDAAQLLYNAPGDNAATRRRTDFYPEGKLIWLEADTIIRQKTAGKKSLDDFCKKFHGGESGAPKVVPYTFDDIVTTLNEIVSYDWREFFQKRVYSVAPHAPVGGIENGGWHLAYTNKPSAALKSREGSRKFTDLSFSVGMVLREDGYVSDVIPGRTADKSGIGVGMKLIAVNDRRWNATALRDAISDSETNHATIELLMENDDYFKTYKLNYRDGEKYPVLVRDSAKSDLLDEILKPLTPEPSEVEKKK
jgi:predicted metalloprotease with PDZ domain